MGEGTTRTLTMRAGFFGKDSSDLPIMGDL